MRPPALLYLYRQRLRVHAVGEALAGIGIAVAVALVFAATVAQGSIAGSAEEVVHAVVGPAQLQVRARAGDGLAQTLLREVQSAPGVKQAAPLLEQSASITAASGRRVGIDLAGTELSLATLDGLARTLPIGALAPGGIAISERAARTLGLPRSSSGRVMLAVRGHSTPLRVTAVLGSEAVGALSRAQVAVMGLAEMQRLAGLNGMVTRILVQADAGREQRVRRELERLTAGRYTVASAEQDIALLHQALGPSGLASGLFAAIGGLLGFLFAFNALLLTVPERRQTIADLRIAGAKRSAIVQMVAFQALCLGLAASAVGLAGGYALSSGVLHVASGYLAQEFTLGGGTVIGARPIVLALAVGALATAVASGVPLADLRRGRPRDAIYMREGDATSTLTSASRMRLLAGAAGLLVLATVLYVAIPSSAILATALLAFATLLAVPLALAAILAGARAVSERTESFTALTVAVTTLKGVSMRSLALAATGAVALLGAVALGGSRQDLLKGITRVAHDYAAEASIWVTSPGDNQATIEFHPSGHARALEALPGVAGVREFQGAFIDLGDRRPWVIARPPDAGAAILAGQIVHGSATVAAARMRAGGWVAVSQQIASEQHTRVGGTLAIPTPSGIARLKVAATTTNFAWPTGVIFISTSDYERLWQTREPTALGVQLAPGANSAIVLAAIRRELGPNSALEVSSALARQRKIEASAGEGLGQLETISTLLLVAAILSMASALGATIWQRRSSLAELRLSGVKPARLRRILLAEASLLLGAGCVTGAIAGIYAQVIVDGYLEHVTGFPVASVAVTQRPLEILASVIAITLAIVAIPGWAGSRVSPTLALEHE